MSDPQAQDLEFEKYYNAMQDMFLSDGWKYLTKDFKETADNLNIVETVKDNEELLTRKGQLNVLANLLNLQSQLETMRAQREEDDESQGDAQ
jgi:hypothetical protein